MRITRTASIVVLAVVCSWTTNAQQRPTPQDRLRTVQFNGVRLSGALALFAADYQITIGLEADPRKPDSTIVLDLHDVAFRNILDGIVRAEPLYKWRDDDGCIDVLPISGGLGLLDSRIQAFQLKDVNRVLAVNRLFGLGEVRALILSKGLKPRPPVPASDRIKDEKLSFDLHDVTVRQALNQIAHDSGTHFWIFRSYADGSFDVSFECCSS